MGTALADLQRTGEPIFLEKGRQKMGVIISMRDFEERFAEKAAADARESLIAEMRLLARPSVDKSPSEEIIRQLRDRAI